MAARTQTLICLVPGPMHWQTACQPSGAIKVLFAGEAIASCVPHGNVHRPKRIDPWHGISPVLSFKITTC